MTFEARTVRGFAVMSRKPIVPDGRIGLAERGDVARMPEHRVVLRRNTELAKSFW